MPKKVNLSGEDVTCLFSGKAIPFSNPRIEEIPKYGSIIYTIWNKKNEFIYVGIAGVRSGVPLKKRNPRSRLKAHASGRRSGNQFCVYVQDFFVIPEIIKSKNKYKPARQLLDKRTQEYIHKNLSYRYKVFQNNNGIATVRRLENEIQGGIKGFGIPFLNGVIAGNNHV